MYFATIKTKLSIETWYVGGMGWFFSEPSSLTGIKLKMSPSPDKILNRSWLSYDGREYCTIRRPSGPLKDEQSHATTPWFSAPENSWSLWWVTCSRKLMAKHSIYLSGSSVDMWNHRHQLKIAGRYASMSEFQPAFLNKSKSRLFVTNTISIDEMLVPHL
jgi:hypothetical protein